MLLVRSLDCQSDTIHLDVIGYGEPPLAAGEDDVVVGASGRELGERIADIYRFRLEGHVKGVGATPDERALSWRAATDQLMAVMSFVLDPGVVEVGPAAPAQFPNDVTPYLGLDGNKTINARCISMVRGPVQGHMSFQTWSFEMECIDSPPGVWEDAGS